MVSWFIRNSNLCPLHTNPGSDKHAWDGKVLGLNLTRICFFSNSRYSGSKSLGLLIVYIGDLAYLA